MAMGQIQHDSDTRVRAVSDLVPREALDAERAARDEAEERRARLARVFAQAPFAVGVTEGPEHLVRSLNEMQRKLIGPRSRDAINQPARTVFPEQEMGSILDVLDEVFKQRTERVVREQRLGWDRRGNGEIEFGYFDMVIAPIIGADDEVEGLLCFTTDVSDSVNARLAVSQARDEAERARNEAQAANWQLEQAHKQLELRIVQRTLELATSNKALAAEIEVRKAAEAARNELQRRLDSAREDEQRRTARDLHDQVGQTLGGLMLAIKAACEANSLPSPALTRLEEALKLAEDLARDIHGIATRLRPAVLDSFGLYAALRQLLSDWSRHSGVSVDFEAKWLKAIRLPPAIETVLYRVTQEALNNVARHARASRVSVVVERHAGRAIAIVEDDGVGFDQEQVEQGRLGLVGMRERVSLAGGTLDLESAPGRGTTVIASVPLEGVTA